MLNKIKAYLKDKKVLLEEIHIWYRFNPLVSVWTDNINNEVLYKSDIWWNYAQTYYGGRYFTTGFFIYIVLSKRKSLHININWWTLNLFK